MIIANEVVPISLNGHGESEEDILILGINIHFTMENINKYVCPVHVQRSHHHFYTMENFNSYY